MLQHPEYSPDMRCHYAWKSEKLLYRENVDSPVVLAGLYAVTNVSVTGKYNLVGLFFQQQQHAR